MRQQKENTQSAEKKGSPSGVVPKLLVFLLVLCLCSLSILPLLLSKKPEQDDPVESEITLPSIFETEQPTETTTVRESVTQFTYGTSGSGKRDLTAYRIGDGPNILLLTFAMHGFDDAFPADGRELTFLGEDTVQFLAQQIDLIDARGWSVYVLPCVNPDGVEDGYTADGPGRCTTWLYNEAGELVYGDCLGIDINRSFPHDFTVFSDSRNYNGTQPLQCPEAKALAELTQNVQGNGKNVCIDVHGWYSQIIPGNREGTLREILQSHFPANGVAGLRAGSGYFTAWCHYELGWDACLLELPGDVFSHEEFLASGSVESFEAAILDLLENYE